MKGTENEGYCIFYTKTKHSESPSSEEKNFSMVLRLYHPVKGSQNETLQVFGVLGSVTCLHMEFLLFLTSVPIVH